MLFLVPDFSIRCKQKIMRSNYKDMDKSALKYGAWDENTMAD